MVRGRHDGAVLTDRGAVTAPLVVDALGWRRVLAGARNQPPEAPLSRGLEVHPLPAAAPTSTSDRPLAGPSWLRLERPGGNRAEGRGGLLTSHATTSATHGRPREPPASRARPLPGQLVSPPAAACGRGRRLRQGRLGRSLLSAVGRGHPHGLLLRDRLWAELKAVLARQRSREQALRRYAAFSGSHSRAFALALRLQWLIPRLPPRGLTPLLRATISVSWTGPRLALDQAHPSFAGTGSGRSAECSTI